MKLFDLGLRLSYALRISNNISPKKFMPHRQAISPCLALRSRWPVFHNSIFYLDAPLPVQNNCGKMLLAACSRRVPFILISITDDEVRCWLSFLTPGQGSALFVQKREPNR